MSKQETGNYLENMNLSYFSPIALLSIRTSNVILTVTLSASATHRKE